MNTEKQKPVRNAEYYQEKAYEAWEDAGFYFYDCSNEEEYRRYHQSARRAVLCELKAKEKLREENGERK
jgi:hypothetical protein